MGQYQAAVHAYAESLARDHDNPDTYYDMGIALHADGDLPRRDRSLSSRRSACAPDSGKRTRTWD